MEQDLGQLKKILNYIHEPKIRNGINEDLLKISQIANPDEMKELLTKLMQYTDSCEVLRREWKNILNNTKTRNKFLETLSEDEEIQKDIAQNLPWLIQETDCNSVGETESIFNIIRNLSKNKKYEEQCREYIYWANLYDEIQLIPGLSKEELEQILTIPSNKELYEQQTRHKDWIFKSIVKSEDKEEQQLVLETISEGIPYTFKSIGGGSLVLQTGEKIVKLGRFRNTFSIPYHPRIMMPKFRKLYENEVCIEFFDLGETEKANVSSETVLEIFKELESAGIFWGDAKKDNILKLKKDNELPDYVSSKNFNIFGFLENPNFPTEEHTVLKAGEYVICDLDHLYSSNSKHRHIGPMDPLVWNYMFQKRKEASQEDGSR